MTCYEYKVVPAPKRGRKAKGVKTPEGRFALGVEAVLNELAQQGWEYLRSELLPSEERHGLTRTAVKWRNVLIFRRAAATSAADPAPEPADAAEAGRNAATGESGNAQVIRADFEHKDQP